MAKKIRKFVDTARIHIFSGKGGDGCNSKYRDKYLRQGRPDGGNGGKGGDVVLVADENVQTLLDFVFHSEYRAKKGANGGSKNKKGRDGEPLILKVPGGTIVKDAQTGEVIGDITKHGQNVLVAEGGKGGLGNIRLRFATKGGMGIERFLSLELRLIADVGIVGFPNTGKSSLLSVLTNARPKIADFPFTTLSPEIGRIEFDNHIGLTAAEIPGIIENAHKGKGLGLDFLRHSLRTKFLVHVLDITKEPYKHYNILNKELKIYGGGLENRLQIVVANKMDLPSAKEGIRKLQEKIKDVFPVSCISGDGVQDLKEKIRQIYEKEISS